MHYLDEGRGAPILLLHGEPTWSFLLPEGDRRAAGELPLRRVPDYFGFGRSGQAGRPRLVPGTTATSSRSPRSSSSSTCESSPWSSRIGARPDRLQALRGAPRAHHPPGGTEHRHRRARAERGVAEVPGVHAPSRSRHRGGAAASASRWCAAGGRRGDRRLQRPVPDSCESRVGIAAFPALVATSSDHPSAAAMLSVREQLRSFDAPALVLFSDSDPIFSRQAAEAMAGLLANAELDPPVAGAGHFPAGGPRRDAVGARIAGVARRR